MLLIRPLTKSLVKCCVSFYAFTVFLIYLYQLNLNMSFILKGTNISVDFLKTPTCFVTSSSVPSLNIRNHQIRVEFYHFEPTNLQTTHKLDSVTTLQLKNKSQRSYSLCDVFNHSSISLTLLAAPDLETCHVCF